MLAGCGAGLVILEDDDASSAAGADALAGDGVLDAAVPFTLVDCG